MILASSARLFAAKGLHGVSMREVAAACALTMPTIYHFFGSKEALYHACLATALDDFVSSLHAILEARETPRKRVDAFIFEICRLLTEEPQYLSFACQWEATAPGVDAGALAALLAALDEVAAATGVGPPSDGSSVGQAILAAAIGQVVVWRALNRGAAPIGPERLAQLVRQVRESALPRSRGRPAADA